jgi:hypothetical protein
MHHLRRKGLAVARPFLTKPWISIPKRGWTPSGSVTGWKYVVPPGEHGTRSSEAAGGNANRPIGVP